MTDKSWKRGRLSNLLFLIYLVLAAGIVGAGYLYYRNFEKMIFLVGALLLGAGVGLIWRQQHLRFYRARAQEAEMLRESEDRYRILFDEALDGVCLADAETSLIIDCNRALAALVGRERAELIGQSQKILHPTSNDQETFSPTFKQHLTDQEGQILETQVVTGTGIIKEVEIKANCLNLQGRKVLQGMFRDITERKRADEALRASLREKEVLLREIHHRVKNNMQVISSLLNLQAERARDNAAKKILKGSQNRIRSIALVHERLYHSADLARVDFSGYIPMLYSHLGHILDIQGERIKESYQLEVISLGVDLAIPCGLILTELISNSMTHAFPGGRKGTIRIELGRDAAGLIRLVVADDGVGLPQDLDFRKTESLGLQIVNMLAEQIDAQVELLTRSPTLSPAFQGGDEKRGSGLTPNKPRHSCRGVEGLTKGGTRFTLTFGDSQGQKRT